MEWINNFRAELVASAVANKADRPGGKTWALLLLPGRGLIMRGSTTACVGKYMEEYPDCLVGVYGRGCLVADIAEDVQAARGF